MKDLIKTIRDNPGCIAVIVNDTWSLYPSHGGEEPLVTDEDVIPLCHGKQRRHGGDILHALAAIVGVRVESL